MPLVHAPLAQWARVRGDAVAISDGAHALTFAQLYAATQQRADTLNRMQVPATVFVDEHLDLPDQVADFLGIITSGRCAAVANPDWSAALRATVLASIEQQPATPSPPQPESPFYIGFTSGSTGIPKGFRRSHQSWVASFHACVDSFGPDAAERILAPGKISHSLFLFGILHGIWSGAGVVVQSRFSASHALDTLQQGETPCLIAVPSQLVLMLVLAARRAMPAIHGVRLILVSGARWMRERTPELQALFPDARIIEFYGSSETSFVAWIEANENTPSAVVGYPFPEVEIDIRSGLIFVRSPMLFMDYVNVHAEATTALRAGEWLSVRDMGTIDDEGRLCLSGRQNRMIVTSSANLFPEELEAVLESHCAIAAASVHGVADPLRGQQVVAVLRIAPDKAGELPCALDISAWCRARLEAFKVPKRYFICHSWDDWDMTSSGKTDHHAIGLRLAAAAPCLHPLIPLL
ncbi:MAG: AMP-binding protein [Rhodoferax sp.]|nr:AMP-binding protein [Rhodoferax sp.]